jgi:hypothetical protein
MNAIKATVKDGQVVVKVPADWPEGCEVIVEPLSNDTPAGGGMREEDWPTTPEGIAALLKRWDELEPLEMTPEEEARWEAIRKEEKEREKARFVEDAERLRGVWE